MKIGISEGDLYRENIYFEKNNMAVSIYYLPSHSLKHRRLPPIIFDGWTIVNIAAVIT